MAILRIGARWIAVASLLVLASRAPAAAAERLVGTYYSAGIVLFFKVPEAAVQKLLPAGWTVAPVQNGAVKGGNLLVSMSQLLTMRSPDGAPGAPALLSPLEVLVHEKGTNRSVAMIVGGLASTNAWAPGPYGNYSLAKATLDNHVHADASGASACEQRWEFFGDDGNGIDLRLKFTCSRAAYAKFDSKIYSAAKPDSYWIIRGEQVVYPVRGDGIDNLQSIDFKALGPRLSQLFDGSEQLLGVLFTPWRVQQTFVPERSGPPERSPGK